MADVLRFKRRQRRVNSWQGWKISLIAAVTVSAVVFYFVQSPWSVLVTAKHLLAAQNCDTARVLVLAPAKVGEPGYWSKLDADNDGIACEPYRAVRAR